MNQWTRKLVAITLIAFCVFIITKGALAQSPASQQTAAQPATEALPQSTAPAVSQDVSQKDELPNDFEKITQLYKQLKADRDNLLAQSKRLLEENKQTADIRKTAQQMEEEKRALAETKTALEEKNKALDSALETMKKHLADITQEKSKVEALLAAEQQRSGMKSDKIKEQLKSEYQGMIDKVAPLKKEKETLAKQVDDSQKDLDKAQFDLQQSQKEYDLLKYQFEELDKDYDGLKKENAYLEQEARTYPSRIAELAKQNQRLIKETSDLHYNMGVFYLNNKEYKRSIAEFEKTLKLKPQDANAHYNLGFIYAEYLVDRAKAIDHFRKYLDYAPDARDAEWVRKYILTWQTWYGKEGPIK